MLNVSTECSAELLRVADKVGSTRLKCEAMLHLSHDISYATNAPGSLDALVKHNPGILENIVNAMNTQRQRHLWRQRKLIADASEKPDEKPPSFDLQAFFTYEEFPWSFVLSSILVGIVYLNIHVLEEQFVYAVPVINLAVVVGCFYASTNFLTS